MPQVRYGANNSAGRFARDYTLSATFPGEPEVEITPYHEVQSKLVIPGRYMDNPKAIICPNYELWLPHIGTKMMPHWSGGQMPIYHWNILVAGAIMDEDTGKISTALIRTELDRENEFTLTERLPISLGVHAGSGEDIFTSLGRLINSNQVAPGPQLKEEGLTVISFPKLPLATS